MKKCQFVKSDGQECMAHPMKDSDFCFTHNPEMEAERRLAVSNGGSAPRKAYEALPEVKIQNAKDVATLLSMTISEVRAGTVELRVANCIGYLSGHLLKAFEISDLEGRLKEVENIITKS